MVNIFHTSIPVKDPKRVAEALSKLFGGRSFNFLHPGCYFVTLGQPGALIELYRKEVVIQPGREGQACRLVDSPDPPLFTGAHTAVRVGAEAEKVFQIAAQYGWRAETHSRGVFHVIESWIENEYMQVEGTGCPEAVVGYIENQEKHHRRINFQDEYRQLLTRHGLARISHTRSAAEPESSPPTALPALGLLDVVHDYGSGGLGRNAVSARRFRLFGTVQ